MMSPTIEIINDAARFAALASEWTALVNASASPHPFVRWEWLHAWWTHLSARDALWVVAVRSEGELIGLAPLRIARPGVPWFARFEFLATGDAGSDYLDLVLRRGHEERALRAIAETIRSRALPLYLTNLPSGSHATSLNAHLGSGWTTRVAPSGICPTIDLAGHTWESYLATLGPAHRANIRRRTNALARRYNVRFERIESQDRRETVLDALMTLHNRRWRTRGGSTAFSTPALQTFHRDVTARALDAGWLRMYALELDGHLAAAMYGFACAGRTYFYQHAFDPRYEHDSPGLVLMALTVRAAIEEGSHEFDMLWGTEPYKRLWARDQHQLERIELFPTHLGAVVQRRATDANRALRQLARKFLARAAS